jgi:hypothetical protein
MHGDSVRKLRESGQTPPRKKGCFFLTEFGWDFVAQCSKIVENQIECVNFNTRSLITQWSDPRINFGFCDTQTLICVCACKSFVCGPRIKFCALAQT